jgi:putative nucleotidyltransferase with HDIG domain
MKKNELEAAISQLRQILPLVSISDLETKLATVKDLPTLPNVVERIFAIASDSSSGVRDLTEVIRQDVALSSKFLRISNSAYYAPRSEIKTLESAVMMIGFTEVKHIVAATRLVQNAAKFCAECNVTIEDFWRHSLATATVAKVIYEKLGRRNIDEIFFAALLHDFGKFIIYHLYPRHFVVTAALATKSDIAFYEVEELLIGTDHTYCGKKVAEKWNLPLVISEIIEHHHNVPPLRNKEGIPAFECAVVHLANYVSHTIFDSCYIPKLSSNVWDHLPHDLKQGMDSCWGKGEDIVTTTKMFI